VFRHEDIKATCGAHKASLGRGSPSENLSRIRGDLLHVLWYDF